MLSYGEAEKELAKAGEKMHEKNRVESASVWI